LKITLFVFEAEVFTVPAMVEAWQKQHNEIACIDLDAVDITYL
jgi:hypothetical protein